MIVFCVLHYLAGEATAACVDRILALAGDKRVVITDNGSPDGSGAALAARYAADDHVAVNLLPDNLGFARGHNAGYRRAKQWLGELAGTAAAAAATDAGQPFIAAVNSDILFAQFDAIQRIERVFAATRFAVLGPDIETPDGRHQNPKQAGPMTGRQAKAVRRRALARLRFPAYAALRAGVKRLPPVRALWSAWQRARQGEAWREPAEGVMLHGAALVFGPPFLAACDAPFDEATFLYFEAELLDRRLRELGLKAVYHPGLRVLHGAGSATQAAFPDAAARRAFQNSNLVASATYFIDSA